MPMRMQPEGWADFDSCIPAVDESRMVGVLGAGSREMTYEECRQSCASDPECYCYAVVDNKCYSGLSHCACETARNTSCCHEAGDEGFMVHKDILVRHVDPASIAAVPV